DVFAADRQLGVQPVGDGQVKRLLSVQRAPLVEGDSEIDQPVGARDVQVRRIVDEMAAVMFVEDSEIVLVGHADGGPHGAVDHLADLPGEQGVGVLADIDADQRHGVIPCVAWDGDGSRVGRLPMAPASSPDRSYSDDLAVGDTYTSATHRLDLDQVRRFATEFDPQPFHSDETAARDSSFQGSAASGWHTAAITMRSSVDSMPSADGV
ncbi:hypothetical protein OY671_008947, partial [Metschnikowia pulcherrima]